MIPFDLDLKLKQTAPRFAALATREVKASEHIPYAALYDANTLLTRNEDLIQVIKIEGLAFETASDDFLQLRKRFRNNLLRTLARSHYALYVHTVRRKQHVYPDGNFPPGFAYDLNQAWRARHEHLALYVNDIYVSVVRKPRMAGVAGFKDFLDQVIGRRFGQEREPALRAAAKDLQEATARIITNLNEYRPQLLGTVETPRGVFSELLRFVGFLANCEDRPLRVPQMDLSRFLSCNRLIFGRDAFEVRSVNKSRVGAILSIKEYESSTEYGLLDEFLTVPVEMIITQSFVFVDRPNAKEAMETQQRRMEQVEDRSLSQIEEIDEALDDISAGRLAEGLHHLTVTIRAPDMRELDRALALVTDAFVNTGVIAVREDLNMELCYWAQLPGNFSYITRGAMISSMNFAAFASLHNYHCGAPHGNHWGPAVSVLETRSGTPYYANWHVGQVGHTLFAAPTGVGKSTLMNFLIAQSVKINPMVIYFDKDFGAEIFVRAMRGVHSTISLGNKTGFNPLQLPDTPANRDFLNKWFALLLTAFGEGLSAQDAATIKAAVEGNYSLDVQDRKLPHVAEFFGLKSPGRLGGRLTNWYGEGRYAALFDNDEDALGFSSRLYGLEMGQIIDDDVACAPVVAYLFHRIQMVLDGQPVMIVLEEGAKLIRNPYFPPMLDDWLTTLRKRNGMVVFVTPDLAAAYKYGSDNLVKQTATKILLANEKADRASYVDQFSLSEGEFEIIRTLNPSERLFLIKHGKDSVLARLDLSSLKEFIPVLSGTTANVQILHTLMEELGSDDPDVWLPAFLEKGCRMKRNVAVLLCALLVGLVSGTAKAQIPVTDGANLTQQLRQLAQMVKDYEMLKQQYDQLKRQYTAITGSYGFGGQFNNATSRHWVPGSWQEIVAMQKSGKFGSKQDFYEKLLKTVDPLIYKALGKDRDSRMYHTYKLSTDATRGAFAAVEALYDSIGERLRSIEGLQGQIENTDNIKAAQDLGNRLLAENAYLNVEMARLNTIQTNLSANAQNMGNQSMAARTEFFNFGKE